MYLVTARYTIYVYMYIIHNNKRQTDRQTDRQADRDRDRDRE